MRARGGKKAANERPRPKKGGGFAHDNGPIADLSPGPIENASLTRAEGTWPTGQPTLARIEELLSTVREVGAQIAELMPRLDARRRIEMLVEVAESALDYGDVDECEVLEALVRLRDQPGYGRRVHDED